MERYKTPKKSNRESEKYNNLFNVILIPNYISISKRSIFLWKGNNKRQKKKDGVPVNNHPKARKVYITIH